MISESARRVLVRVRSVTKRYGSGFALENVAFELNHQDFLAVIGPSGSGKSTLLKLIANVESPTKGSIEYCDGVVGGRDTVVVWQSLALFPHMNVADNVAFGLRMQQLGSSVIRVRVEEILCTVGLEGLGNRTIKQLSGGEQQRVAVARALIVRPRVLLLDEPFASLDPHLRERLQLEVIRLHREFGLTTILVTHDQTDAMATANRVIVLNQGHVEQDGTPEQIYEAPRSPFVARFVGRRNVLDGAVSGVSQKGYSVKTNVGVLHVGCTEEPKYSIGTQVVYIVDAERMVGGSNAENSLRGEVFSAQRLGSAEMLRIRVGSEILMCQRFSDRQPLTAVGAPITLSWASSDALILPV